MDSDSVAALNDAGASGAGEHLLSRILLGDVESVRSRLADGLEQLGYYVLKEEPLVARRAARGWASWIGSNNVLNYSVALTIAVKPLSAGVARITFCYALKHRMLTNSGRQTLTREAEAMIALAAMRSASAGCVACGATAAVGSRFCRQCGTPTVSSEPAEVEVLKVTAGLCAGYTRTVFGAIILALTFIALLLGMTTAALPRTNVVVGVSLLLGALGWALLLTGLRRLHYTLNPKGETGVVLPVGNPQTGALSDMEASHSMRVPSEKTTALLSGARDGQLPPAPKRDREDHV
ncbi:MAG TPA: hypothetical protein VF240_06915 [Pyrinomonadaceae bacterium]